MNKTVSIVSFCITILLGVIAEGRNSEGATLELKGKIWHGAGQAGVTGFDGFENYWNTAPVGQKPNVFMDYYDTWNMNERWSMELKQELLRYHRAGYYVVPQIGINIFYLWRQYLDGSQDDELENFIEGLKYLAMPCFLRVGYEWNNYPRDRWLQPPYKPEELKKVFEIICSKIKESGLEMACVWNLSLSGNLANDRNMMEYWPGTEYMDWMGFNAFTGDIMTGTHPLVPRMCTIADSLGIPVMIGEASPNTMNGPNNHADWEGFGQYNFYMIDNNPQIKQMCYINWAWGTQDMVGGNGLFPWGDSRLQNPGSMKDKWFGALKDEKYLHATDEKTTRSYFNFVDTIAPTKVTIQRDDKHIVWEETEEKGGAGLAHYTIYKDGKLWDYIIDPKYPIRDLYNGTRAHIEVTAMDRAGNESLKSNRLEVELDKSYELIWDGGFNYPATSVAVDWRWMGTMDGGAKPPPDDIYIDTTGKITGKYSCWLPDFKVGENNHYWKFQIKNNPQDWKVQLFQCFQVQKDERYTIRFKAVAKEPRVVTVCFMDHHVEPDHTFIPSNGSADPKWESNGEWQYYNTWDAEVGTEVKSFKFEATAPETECARLSIMFGKLKPTEMWFDDVSVAAGDPNIAIHTSRYQSTVNHFNLRGIVNSGNNLLTVKYSLPQRGKVSLLLFDAAGKQVNQSFNTHDVIGSHSENMDIHSLSSGVYYLKLNANNKSAIKNIVIVR